MNSASWLPPGIEVKSGAATSKKGESRGSSLAFKPTSRSQGWVFLPKTILLDERVAQLSSAMISPVARIATDCFMACGGSGGGDRKWRVESQTSLPYARNFNSPHVSQAQLQGTTIG